jgi:hypothetical protein
MKGGFSYAPIRHTPAVASRFFPVYRLAGYPDGGYDSGASLLGTLAWIFRPCCRGEFIDAFTNDFAASYGTEGIKEKP